MTVLLQDLRYAFHQLRKFSGDYAGILPTVPRLRRGSIRCGIGGTYSPAPLAEVDPMVTLRYA